MSFFSEYLWYYHALSTDQNLIHKIPVTGVSSRTQPSEESSPYNAVDGQRPAMDSSLSDCFVSAEAEYEWLRVDFKRRYVLTSILAYRLWSHSRWNIIFSTTVYSDTL